ncbi:hypothetical protein MMSYN1_0306 [synthetic Mycoplasma mycoides JCVI-syn1.0]|nr:hypothetical protein MMSYN1_0306 [synthetic Mycoplasma mycoides JCVI-syn1.0]
MIIFIKLPLFAVVTTTIFIIVKHAKLSPNVQHGILAVAESSSISRTIEFTVGLFIVNYVVSLVSFIIKHVISKTEQLKLSRTMITSTRQPAISAIKLSVVKLPSLSRNERMNELCTVKRKLSLAKRNLSSTKLSRCFMKITVVCNEPKLSRNERSVRGIKSNLYGCYVISLVTATIGLCTAIAIVSLTEYDVVSTASNVVSHDVVCTKLSLAIGMPSMKPVVLSMKSIVSPSTELSSTTVESISRNEPVKIRMIFKYG